MSLGAREETAIRAEMTASERCAMLRFQFPKSGVARVLIETFTGGTTRCNWILRDLSTAELWDQ